MLVLVSIAPWSKSGPFYIMFLFQLLQLFLYLIVGFTMLSNFGQTRLFCCVQVRIIAKGPAFFLRLFTALVLVVLALYTHFLFEAAAVLIGDDAYKKAEANKDFRNSIEMLIGANLMMSMGHLVCAAAELISAAVGLCKKGLAGP